MHTHTQTHARAHNTHIADYNRLKPFLKPGTSLNTLNAALQDGTQLSDLSVSCP